MYTITVTFTHGDDLIARTGDIASTVHRIFTVYGAESVVNLRITPSHTAPRQVEIPFPLKGVVEK